MTGESAFNFKEVTISENAVISWRDSKVNMYVMQPHISKLVSDKGSFTNKTTTEHKPKKSMHLNFISL